MRLATFMKGTHMKISAVITAIAMAFAGTAFAQSTGDNGPGNNSVGQANPQAAKDFKDLKAKTKRGLHRMTAKARNAMHRDKHHAQAGSGASNTSAMGASSDTAAARQRRMDEAYANWQAKQAKR
jgi:hypothetical protein